MPISKFSFSVTSRQEAFSRAYIAAIAARVGFKVVMNGIDEDSIDFSIQQNAGLVGKPYYSTLRVQAKCRSVLKANQDGKIPVRISQKNYDDLRAETGDINILAVLRVPSQDEVSWINEKPDSMELFNVAYWLSLRGMPAWPSSNKKPRDRIGTVHIPPNQKLEALID